MTAPRRRWFHVNLWTLFVVVTVMLGVSAICCVVCGVYASLEAEKTHQAYIMTLKIVTEFCRDHLNDWPSGGRTCGREIAGGPCVESRGNGAKSNRSTGAS